MKKFLTWLLLTASVLMIASPLAPLAAAPAAEAEVSIVSIEKSDEAVTLNLHTSGAAGEKIGDVFFAVYDERGRLAYVSERKDALVGTDAYTWTGVDFASEANIKAFLWDATTGVPLCEASASVIPALPVLFEKGQWAAALGEITVHTPGGDSAWAYEDGLIRIYNGVPVSKNVAFRFVFENLVDMRGYDAVVMELEEAPAGWFGGILRFRIDQDAGWGSDSHTDIIRMESGTNVSSGMVGMSAGNWDLERLRGVGGLPAYGESVRIKKIYLEGDGNYAPVTINGDARNLMDIYPPRTGNTPVRTITTSSQYAATVAWSPSHPTFRADTVYTATITLTPKPGWKLDGVPANWFRIYYPTGGAVQVTHEAGSGILTHTFPATKAILPYPEPTQFVALSFDDVYLSDTEALVDVLDRLGVKGTFFANGINLEKAGTRPEYKRALDKLIDGGHELESHAWQHERYDNTADENVTRENFKRNQDVIFALTGKMPRWIRIPYASHGTMSLRVAGEFGLTNLRGLATNDWDFPNSASRLVNTILTATGNNSVRDGQIYVSHNQPGQTNTVQALPEIVHELRSRGVGFMTIAELREHRNFTASPGVNYANFFQNSATPQVITLNTQPTAPAAEALVEGHISGSLTVRATAAQGAALSYQWYMNTTTSSDNWVAIDGAASDTFAVPTDLTEGTYYYDCKISAPNAPSLTSNVVAVVVTKPAATELPVLFEKGQWAAALGEITVHTPGGTSTWAYEDGLIRLSNNGAGAAARNIPFRFVFENLVDMRGYDAVVIELDEAPVGWFRSILRFRIDQDAAFDSLTSTDTIRIANGTNAIVSPGINIGFSTGNWDLQRLRGVGALPDLGESVKIKKVYLEGDGVLDAPARISFPQIRDIVPPRTGNAPVTSVTTSNQYTATVEWSPNDAVFQPDTVYTATVTLTPRPGWTLDGIAANWFRIYNITGTGSSAAGYGTTHAAGSGVITKTFPATKPAVPYPVPTQFVALSFDDTISPNTNDLLDVLDALDVKATFFIIGNNLEKSNRHPEYKRAIDRIVAGGHEAGNHTWQHERWTNADPDVMMTDFLKAQNYLREFTGKDAKWIRFPYDDKNANITTAAGQLGLSNSWGFDTNDWDLQNSASYLVNRYFTQTNANNRPRGGQVYVHHDHQDYQNSTKKALPEIVHELRSRGIDFKTVSELREYYNAAVTPGNTYSNFFPSSRITIDTHPAASTTVTAGGVTGSLTVAATATPSAELDYQWYAASADGWTAVDGAASATFELPTDLTEGTYYYYCVVSSPGAPSVTSNVVAVVVAAPLPLVGEVRPIAAPVAGHFPAGLFKYPYKANLYNNTGTAASVGNGFNQTLTWEPAIDKAFLPNTEYTVTLTLEPNAGWSDCGMPGTVRSFAVNAITPAQIAGLPSEGVKATTWEYEDDNLLIHITFSATASAEAAPDVVFYEDFSKGVHEDKTVGEGKFMLAQQANRQGLGNWRDNMTTVRVREDGGSELVLGYKKDPDAAPANASTYVKNNFITAGGVRTRGRTTAQGGGAYGSDDIIYENAFGYYEANVKFPQSNAVWGAFWLFSPATAAPLTIAEGGSQYATEIDIIESAGYLAKTFNAAYHTYRSSIDRNINTGPRRDTGRNLLYPNDPGWETASRMAASEEVSIESSARRSGIDIYDGKFHKIGLEWSPTDYIFTVDGVVIGSWKNLSSHYSSSGGSYSDWSWIRQNEGVLQNPAYIKLTVEAAEWADESSGKQGVSPDSGEMVVDYVYVLNGPKSAVDKTALQARVNALKDTV
ncbi:MAG: polysaccharide deacetylase family protein [Oscillospiraceae bacterium]|jgi:peptidoglycan/xylan/chitin deacetylase (PgdA/CDA1 family)|nr:polysaccharide deacetylase family protein [Oscillospiraceae bacterium]